MLALGDQVLLGLADFRRDDHLALALGVLAERDHAVDLGDDRVLLRLARFEQLGDARQTAGDVLGLRGLARDLGDDVAGLDLVAVVDVDVGADRQEVARLLRRARDLLGLAVVVLDRDTRTRVGVLRLDDDLAREAGDLVELLLHRHLSMMSPYFTMPATSVRIGIENGSHSDSSVLAGDLLRRPSTSSLAP